MGSKNHQVNIPISSVSEHVLHRPGKLSVTAEEALSIYLRALNERLHDMLSNADDHLFDKSGKSEDSHHFAAMRTLRVKKNLLLNSFKQEVIHTFKQAIGQFDDSEFQTQTNVERLPLIESASDSGTFEHLALVQDDDLEEQIAIDSIINKARESNCVALEHLKLRLQTLKTNKIALDEINPFEPSFICSAFSRGLKPIELDMEFQLVLYKYFERNVIKELDFIYQQTNAYFIERDILPELKAIPLKRKRDEVRRQKLPDNTSSNSEADSSGSTNDNQAKSNQNNNNSAEILNLLGELLASNRGNVTSQVSQQVNTDELVGLLSNIQIIQSENNLENISEEAKLTDVRGQITHQLPSDIAGQVVNGALGQFNDDMIDVVTMLFDFILDDENLQAEVRAVIARLQIPILKVGLVDKSFFSDRKHNARLLLNELARAGLSWDRADRGSEPMLQKIQVVVETICSQFNNNVEIFEQLLQDFVRFKNEYQKRAIIFERRTREAEEGKARSESAKGKVNRELRVICSKKHVPEVVQRLFKNVWVQVMFLENLRADVEAWDRVCKVAKMLVWSVQPVNTTENLNQLTKTVPVLIKNLKLGFKKVALSNIESSGLLDKLEDTHRQVIKDARQIIEVTSKETILRLKPQSMLIDPSNVEDPAHDSISIESSDLSSSELVIPEKVNIEEMAFSRQELGFNPDLAAKNIKVSNKSRTQIDNLHAGSWFELKINNELIRCKLAARIISSDKFIFVNRSGAKIAEYFGQDLAAEYQVGNLKLLDDEALFDRALESVISTLRNMKPD